MLLWDKIKFGHIRSRTKASIEEGYDLRPGAGIVGSKPGGIHTIGNAHFHRPKNRIVVILTGRNILEGVCLGSGSGGAYQYAEKASVKRKL